MDVVLNVNKRLFCDVAVVGGGTAGVFAAICSARAGADTVLIEKNSALGGTMTVGGVNYPGLFFAWGRKIIDGPCWEAIERVKALGGAQIPDIQYSPREHWKQQVLLDRFLLTATLFEMCAEAGVRVLTNAMLTSLEERDDGVTLYITEKQGLCAVNAKNLIDGTGDASAVSMAGYETVRSEVQQPATLTNSITGYELENVYFEQLETALGEQDLPEYITMYRLKKWLTERRLNIHVPSCNAHTSEGRTDVEIAAYSLLLRLYSFLRTVKGLEGLRFDYVAAETGVRETVRIVGEYMVTVDDYLGGRSFDDAVCYAFYPVDLHVMEGVRMTYHEPEKVPQIPYRALLPMGTKHIICAGRAVSSDTDANSGLRVEAACMAMGQAAGVAAAIAARDGIALCEVEYIKLTESLRSLGAIVPN